MISQKRILAARANGARSRGPLNSRTGECELSRLAGAFAELASTPQLGLLHRYETRLHVMYQRAFHNLLLMRNPAVRNEPKNPCVSITDVEVQAPTSA